MYPLVADKKHPVENSTGHREQFRRSLDTAEFRLAYGYWPIINTG
jgi:hypothetical protein